MFVAFRACPHTCILLVGEKNAANISGKPTEENPAADEEKMPPQTDASTGSDTPSNSNSSQESDDDDEEEGTEPGGDFDKEGTSKLRKRRKRKSQAVNTVQATPEEKLEAEDRARRLLKRARRFLRAGRTKRSANEQYIMLGSLVGGGLSFFAARDRVGYEGLSVRL